MTSSQVLVDTSVWVALFQGDPRVNGLEKVMGDRHAVVSSLVLGELQSLCVQGRLGEQAVQDVLSVTHVEPLLTDDAIAGGKIHGKLRNKGKSKVNLADALLLATAHRIGAHLLTLNHDLKGEESLEILEG